jgi:hypothetical protein
VGDAVGAEREVLDGGPALVRLHEAQVVVVARHALATAAQHPALLEPAAQAVDDHHLIPEGPLGSDGGDTLDRKIDLRKVFVDLRPYGHRMVWIER